MFSVFSQPKNPVLKRCLNDEVTRLRLKYDPYYHAFERQQGSKVWLDGREMIMMCSNDYLGLSEHPKVIEAAKAALEEWGSSPTGSRLANGSRLYHRRLEEKMAAFLSVEAVHVHVAGYISCMSSVQPFAQRGDLILADKNLHSSLWSGIGLTQARVERFAHNNPSDLKEVLELEKPEVPKIVIFEGVYSMEGHIGRVPEIVELAEAHDAFTILDDAHGFGVLGEQGRGTANHFGLTDRIHIQCGSLSKALSSTGGFVAGSQALIDYLRSHSKQTIFSAAISPPQAAAAEASLELIQTENPQERLWAMTDRYKEALTSLGFDIWDSETPAVPVVVGNRERAFRFWQFMLQQGVFTTLSTAPAVPPGKDLLRTSVSARHTEEDIDQVIDAFAKAAKRF